MNAHLPCMEGEALDPARSQWFTPPEIADRLVRFARLLATDYQILEPAAGRGALLRALHRHLDHLPVSAEPDVFAWEIDPAFEDELLNCSIAPAVHIADFLAADMSAMRFDLAILNPPYERNQDVRFVERALDCSKRVVGIFQSRIVHSKGRAEFWRWHNIDRLAILSERPRFGGEHSAKTDFVVMEVTRRGLARKQGEATPGQIEWW